ncbi:Rv3235 family protein [Actinomyces trachealis]|uniref:Rv3235 family protein n=1 Tax=Actinomyces trachealis TaxID=2763540 RepID=UPI001FD135EB|nr:Rv3235 family protein [Actinomyces trachealis]
MTTLTPARPASLEAAPHPTPQRHNQKRSTAQAARTKSTSRKTLHPVAAGQQTKARRAHRTQAPIIRITVAPTAGTRQPRRVERTLAATPRVPMWDRDTSLTGSPVLSPASLPRQAWDRAHFRAQADLPEAMSLVELATCPRPAAPTDPPEKAAEVLVRASFEVLTGRRSAQALVRHTTPELFDAIARRSSLAQRESGRLSPAAAPTVRSSHAQEPVPGRAEAVVLLETAGRVRAAAARLLLRRGRWILAGLEIA